MPLVISGPSMHFSSASLYSDVLKLIPSIYEESMTYVGAMIMNSFTSSKTNNDDKHRVKGQTTQYTGISEHTLNAAGQSGK
jgi:hypothetical protein